MRKSCIAFALLTASAAFAQIEPAFIFSTNMVLQRDRPVPVWGRGTPGEKVTVTFGEQTVGGVVDAAGNWRVELAPMKANAVGQLLKINETVFKNVVVGEVWLCSGQSNMEMVLWGQKPYVGRHGWRETNGYIDQLLVDEPDVRWRKIPNVMSDREQELTMRLKWQPFVPGQMSQVSAVAFHYALTLHRALKVPVGVIVAAWGGTNIEPWISPDGFRSVSGLEKYATAPIQPKSSGIKDPHKQPRALWNAMIHPLAPFAFRGVLWYQGGSNIDQEYEYKKYLHALYNGWARAFRQEVLPFYLVQIAPLTRAPLNHPRSLACGLWQAEADFAKEIPNGGMAVIVDVTELDNCHPGDKRTVALRLAALALNKTYGRKDVPCQSPELKSARMDGGKVRLTFDHVDQWILHGTDKPKFELAGTNGVFRLADTEFEKGGVALLSCKDVPEPKKVRYHWNWSWSGKLKNDYGLPLGPFAPVDIGK